MISIICACNNEDVFKKMLLPSIKKQKYSDYEIIKLDSKSLGLKGAANTLNHGATLAKGDILLFVHQDIEFLSDEAFDQIVNYCENYDFSIAGNAGVNFGVEKVFSSVIMGLDRIQAGEKITQVKYVDSIDECLMIIKRDNFKKFVDYSSWHFYGVEYSLRSREHNENVIVFPIEIYHLSPGWSLDNSYWDTLIKVAKNHKNLKIIPTTMGQFHNNFLLKFKIMYIKLKKFLKSKIKM